MTRREKRHAVVLVGLVLTVLVSCGIAFRDLPLTLWNIWRLESPDKAVKRSALTRLRATRAEIAVPYIVKLIRSTDGCPPWRREAFETISEIDPRASKTLTRLLEDDDWTARFWAACFLGHIGERAKFAVPALSKTQYDDNASVAEAAKIAIERILHESRIVD